MRRSFLSDLLAEVPTMRRLLTITCSLLLLSGLTALTRGDESATPEKVRATIEKSLPYLETAGADWIEKRKCITCHRISFMTWGYREASRRGFTIDADKLQERLTWSFDTTITPDKTKPAACAKNPDGIGQLLIGHSAPPFALTDDQQAQFVAALIKVQKENGSWKPEGQLPGQKRPIEETTQVSTLWNTIGLGHVTSTEAIQESRAKALAFLETTKPGKSTESYAALLVLHVQEKKADKVAELLTQLKGLQREDGGFGWLTTDESDALGTGQALYALTQAGLGPNDEAVQKSVKFLISTQQENGSWAVKGTKEGRKNKIEETATYWGSAWATIALLQTLPVR
jgi:hypothetical protein